MALIVAFVVAVLAAPVSAVVARRLGIVDHPGPHKPQVRAVPYLGGVAVLAAIAGPIAVTRPALLAPVGLAFLLGLVDDVSDLPPKLRLLVEVAIGVVAAVVVAPAGLVLGLLTIALVVGLLNAVNLLDGLDGLAAGVGLVSAAGFAIVLSGDFRVAALALTGALAGFLVWNRPPARIYLGDAGSYLMGTLLAVLVAASFGEEQATSTTAGTILFVAVPIADTSVAIVRRLRARRPLFQADRGHVYDQLIDRGWPRSATTLACVGAQAVLCGVGIGLTHLSGGVALPIAVAVVAVAGVAALWHFTAPDSWIS